MKMDELVSIIVPIYNVEKYLEKCIISLLNQSYENIEIILVDDGSTDNSGLIAKSYEKKYNNVLYYHKENGGLSDARNYGIKKAKGKYICFIDSDDYIEKDHVLFLYNSLKKCKASIACGAKKIISKRINVVNNNEEFCVSGKEALKRMLINKDIDCSACDKLFDKKLFNNIQFPKGNFYEDMGTMYKLFFYSNNVCHINYPGYNYIIRKGSISHNTFSKKQFDLLLFSKDIISFIKKNCDELIPYSKTYYNVNLMNVIVMLKNSNNYRNFHKEYKNLICEFDKKFKYILFDNNMSNARKVLAVLIKLRLFKIVYVLKRNK